MVHNVRLTTTYLDKMTLFIASKMYRKSTPIFVDIHVVKPFPFFLWKPAETKPTNGSRNNKNYMIYSLRSKKFNTLKTEMTL